MTAFTQDKLPYRLGLPAWAFPAWKERYFSGVPSMLANYACVFNTVEGNTTFYATPEKQTVRNWAAALDGKDFNICFKLPRTITHQHRPERQALNEFFLNLSPLSEHCGPFLLQFPDWVGIDQLKRMEFIFDEIACNGTACVEVRHPQFFNEPQLLEPLLKQYRFGRVILDSRALFQGDLSHPEVLAAVHEKPDVPVLNDVYNDLIMIRLILHPDERFNSRFIEQWAQRTVAWISQGLRPNIMIHCPNNAHCPEMALGFHERVRQLSADDIPALPSWPLAQQGLLF